MRRGVRARFAPWLLAGFGFALTATAVGWHLGIEAREIGRLSEPVFALALDGLLPLVLIYGSYHLVSSSTPGEQIWTVLLWSLGGSVIVGSVIGLSVLIRVAEGRIVAEPIFAVLLAAETGAVAGFVAGTFAIRARTDAERATQTANTLSFVNDLLRHDIANGLVVIDGRATILERNAESETTLAAAEAIHEQVTELDRLVDNAGAVAETLGSDPEFEPVDIVAIAETVIQRIERTHNVDIDLQAPASAMVYANAATRSVLWNLIENAVEHGTLSVELAAEGTATDGAALHGSADQTDADAPTVDGYERPSVIVTIREADNIVETHVIDDGPGVPADERESVFDARAGDTHGGGLHLVQTLVDSFGGDIYLADAAGGRESTAPDTDLSGAHFVVELPRA